MKKERVMFYVTSVIYLASVAFWIGLRIGGQYKKGDSCRCGQSSAQHVACVPVQKED